MALSKTEKTFINESRWTTREKAMVIWLMRVSGNPLATSVDAKVANQIELEISEYLLHGDGG